MSGDAGPISHVDAVLKAYDALETSLDAEDIRQAASGVRADLEVLSHGDLVSVATAITVEATRQLLPAEAKRLRKWLRFARVEQMWMASDVESGS